MAGRVEGKVAMVTGAASGIGRASALHFASEGARVVVADIDAPAGEETVRLIRAAGGEGRFAPVDVTDADSVRELVDMAVSAYGRLDCAHNNAGVLGPVGDLVDCTAEDYHRVIAVNLTGVWNCMQAEIAQMLGQTPAAGAHSIVNTASVAGLVGSPSIPAYSASKHGVVGLTKSAARAYGARGIRVNCVCPGPIETPLSASLLGCAGVRDRMLGRQAMDRFGEPEEVASLVVWLSSAEASLVTGSAMRVDAGALA